MPTNPSYRIKSVEITNDTLTSRGGISLFVKYLQAIDIVRLLLEKFGGLKKSRKGVTVQNFFLQVLCFFMEGTSRHLTYCLVLSIEYTLGTKKGLNQLIVFM